MSPRTHDRRRLRLTTHGNDHYADVCGVSPRSSPGPCAVVSRPLLSVLTDFRLFRQQLSVLSAGPVRGTFSTLSETVAKQCYNIRIFRADSLLRWVWRSRTRPPKGCL